MADTMMRIKNIRINGGTQSRAEIDQLTVSDYAEAMKDPDTVFPPVSIYHDGKDYWLADGFHRVHAAIKLGRVEIAADVRQGDKRTAILHSLKANTTHGLRRTNADKRRAVMVMLEDDEWSGWSDREIARQCVVTHPTVATMRKSVTGKFTSEKSKEEDTRTYKTRHGTEAEMKVRKAKADAADDKDINEAKEDLAVVPTKTKPDPDAKQRKEFRSLSKEAQEDDWVSLRKDFAESQKRIAAQRKEIADLKVRIKDLESEDDAGRKIGNLQRRLTQSEARSKEHQAERARLQRQVNAQKRQIKDLEASLVSQEIKL